MPILTVTTSATSRGLISLATLKDEIGITDTASDIKLRRWIAEETGRICDHCGLASDQTGRKTFASETMTVSYSRDEIDIRPNAAMILPWRIPAAIVSVVEDGVTLTASQYQVAPMAALLYRLDDDGDRTVWAKATVTVTITAGWDLAADEHPEPLRRACLELVRARWLTSGRDPNLKVDEVQGVSRQEFWVSPTSPDADGLPSDIAAMVAPYANFAIG